MFEKSENFPENWFFIKNHSNGYVLMVDNESQETGSAIVLSTIRTKDYASQLWRYDPKGFLVNKKSGQVMDVAKGNAKAGVDIVQQIQSDEKEETNYQKFGLSPHGHIYLINKSSLVLGIKESFFARREGLHVHLQLVDKRHLDRKEQRWDFVLPVVKDKVDPIKRQSSTTTSRLSTVAQIKEDDARSVHSTGSARSSIDQEEATRTPSGSFPDSPFFLKSDASGLYISTESITAGKAGSQLTIEALRKKGYDSQLWTYDVSNNRIVNKLSKLVLGIENNSPKDGAYIHLSTLSSAQDKTQSWTLSPEGEVTLKSDPSYVLGFKESWFGNREGAHLHLQKKVRGNQQQKFTVVMPIFRKTETTKVEKRGVFPEGWFFVKSQAHGLVLTVLETGVIAAEVEAAKLDTSNYARQLWKCENGYLVNKVSEMVLDIRGGSIVSGSTICQYTKKTENNQNQQWGLTVEGSIHPESNKNLVLTVKENELVRSALFLSEKKTADHKGQCWNFVVPVFKKKTVTSTVKKTSAFKLANYPSGWFFIRSHVQGSTTESPYVLTANEKSIELSLLDRENWQYQLWSYSEGKLVNYSTDLIIHVNNFTAGSELIQTETSDKEWYMTMDGYLLYGSDKEKFALSANLEKEKYKLTLTTHKYAQELQWGFLIPKFGYRHGYQILIQWSVSVLREWRKVVTTTTTTVDTTAMDHPDAEWPQGEFFIRGSDNYALVPEKSQVGSPVTMKQLTLENADIFKWTYKNGYLVHVVSKFVLRIQDKWVDGAKLQLTKEIAGDEDQYWSLKTNGQIVSQKDRKYGLNLVQINGAWTVHISSTVYYAWRLLYGKYQLRYSEKEKKEISYLISFQRIILTLLVNHKHNVERKLVTRSFGVFPEGWLFIRSKKDSNLVITISEKKKGSQLILSKLNTKTFAYQLWRYRDDGCLVNMETDYVIDVAGGKLLHNASVIQWTPKFLRSSRKNQIWALSVDGHIHTQTNTNLVLAGQVKEGAQLKLVKRSDINQEVQQWTFARPVFGKTTYTTYAAQQAHRGSLSLEKVGGDAPVSVSKADEYERVEKRIITRRWGIFPAGGFFIRCKGLGLTVERDEKTSEYRLVLRTLNFKQYKLQYWTYQDGYLINEETGLVLDAQASEDVSVEGVQTQVYLKEKSSNEGQFWDLGVDGEIHLRSNERLTIGVPKADDVKEGALVGLQKIRVIRSESNNKQVSELKSDSWLRWTFSKPVFGKRAVASNETTEAAVIESCEEQTTTVQEQDEVLPEDEEDEELFDEEDTVEQPGEESDLEIQTPIQTPLQTPSSSSNTSSSKAGVSIITAGTLAAAIEAEASKPKEIVKETAKDATVVKVEKAEEVLPVSRPQSPISRPRTPSSRPGSPSRKPKRNSSDRTNRNTFKLDEDYIPTGFEKVVRYMNHTGNFPDGYFFIKSSLHGFVLELVGNAVDGADIVLTPMKSTDFAGQLWSCKDEYLVNLKGGALVLDAAKDALAAGERVHLSNKASDSEGNDDQLWEMNHEKMILLRNQRHIVLSLKDLKPNPAHTKIDVYCQEAKALVKKEARPEQRWEILIPSLIPISQGESGVKIVKSSKVDFFTSSAAAVVSYKWLKETFCHRVTEQNQWPSTEGWFFIRFGAENHFIASGETSQSDVGLYEINEKSDYRRFLWTYIDGYLINYRYNLRLILNNSRRWVLSNSHTTLNQKFYISPNGTLSVRISKIVYYIRFIHQNGSYTLDVTTDDSIKESQGLEMHIPVISDTEYQKNLVEAYSTAYAFVRKQKTDWSILSASASTRRAIFPVSTWFFVKVSGAEDLVLSTTEDKPQLALKKLDFKNFKTQLWTFNDGHLINYGNKFVITVEGSVATDSKVIYAPEAGVSTQKWILTTDGHIELEAHERLVLSAEDIKDSQSIVIGSSNTPSTKLIQWKFSTPVFGKKTTDVTKAIDNGAVIESEQEVTSINKANLALTRRSTKTSTDTYRETLVIIRWWRVVLLRRISTCRTQKEYLQVLEEYRQLLHSRFIQYLTVYRTSVQGQELRAIEDFVAETEQTLEDQIFTKAITHLKGYMPEDEVKDFDFPTIVTESCGAIEKKLESIVESKPVVEKVEEIQSETETVDRSVIVVDKVHVVVRRYIIVIRRRVVEATKQGAKPEEIAQLIEDSRKELDNEITEIQTDAQNSLNQSPYVSAGYKKQLEQSVSTVIEGSKAELDQFVSNVDQVTHYTDEDWNKITGDLDNKVTECKESIEAYENVTEVEEQPVHVDEKEVEHARLDIVATVTETKTYLKQWFLNFKKDLAWTVQESPKDTTTVVEAARLEAVSKLDETIALLSMLSGSLTNLTWAERRRIVTYLITLKTHLSSNIEYIQSQPDNALQICDSTFGSDQEKELLKNMDIVVEKVTGQPVVSEDTHISRAEVVQTGNLTETDVTDANLVEAVDHPKDSTLKDIAVGAAASMIAGTAIAVASEVSKHHHKKPVDVKTTEIAQSGDKETVQVEESKVVSIEKPTSEATNAGVIAGNVAKTVITKVPVQDIKDSVTVQVEAGGKTSQIIVDTTKQPKTEKDVTSAVIGAVTQAILDDKEITTVVESIVETSESVPVQVFVDNKDSKPTTQINVVVKETEELTVRDKEATKPVTEATEVTKEVTVVETTEVTGVIADTVTEILVADKETVSAIEDVVKEAKYVTVEVVAGDKVTKTIVDTTTVTEDVILGSKDKPFTSSVVVGAVTEAITDDKDVTAVLESIVEANEGVAINIIVGEQDVDTTAKDQIFVIVKKTDVLVEEDKPTVKTIEEIATVTSVITGKVVETIVDNEEVVSAVETIAQESDKVTVDVVTKDKTTKAVVDTSKVQAPKSTDAENIVVGVIGSTVAEIVTKDKDTEDTIKEIVKETGTVNVDVTAGDKKTGKPVKDSQIEVIVKSDEVVLDEKDVSKPVTEVTEVTKEVTVVETTEVTGVIADTVTEILVADKETVSAIEDVVKEAKYVTVEVVAGDKVTKTIVDTTTVTEDVILGSKDKPFTSSVVVGAVTEAITDDKDVTAVLESIVEANEGVAINIIVGEQDVDTTAKDQIFVIVKKTDVLVEEDKPTVKTIEEIATVTSVITGKVVETIVDNEEVVSAVETIAQESEKVTVDVVTKDKTTKAVVDTSKVQAPKSTDAENIVVGVIGSTVAEIVTKDKDTEDTIKEIVKETGTVNVDVTAGDKKTGKPVKDSQIEVIVKSDEVVLDEKDVSKPVTEVTEVTKEVTVVETTEVTGVIADTVTEILVADKETVSAIEDVVKEAKYVTVEVVAGDKVTKTIVDTTTVTEDVILGSKDKPFTSSVVVGAVTEAITDDKDVTAVLESIVEANEGVAINIIVGEQDVDTTAKDQIFVIVKKTDVLVEEDKPTVKTIEEIATVTSVITGKVVETIVDNEEVVSAVETIAQESEKVTVDVVTKDKTTKAVVDTSKVQAPKSTDAENIVVGVIGSTVAEIVTKDKDTEDTIKEIVKETGTVNVDVTAGDKKTGKPVKDSQIEVIVKSDEVVLDEKDVSKPVTEVTEVTKEVTVVETTEVTGVIADTVTEILVADKETVSAIEDVVKEAKYVTVEVVAGDKVTKTIVDTTTVTEDVILGSKDKPFTSSVVVGAVTEAITDDKDVTAVLESIVEANEGVAINIIVGEQDVDTTAKDQIFVIVKKTDVLVEEDKPTVKTIEEIATVTSVITGKVVETIVDNEEVVSAVETIAQESEKVTVDVVTKDKTTKAVVDTSKVQAPKSTDAENIVVGVIGSTVAEIVTKDKDTEDTIKEIVKETGTVNVDVTAGDKKTGKPVKDSQIEVIVKSDEVVLDEKDVSKPVTEVTEVTKEVTVVETTEVTGVIADTVTEILVADKETVSAIEDVVKEAKYVTVEVVAGDKVTKTIVDTTTVTEDVILGSKDKPFTSSVVVGAVTEAITDDKDVTAVLESIVEANEGVAINIIVGEQDVDTTAKDQIFVIVKKTDVLVEEDKPTVKTIEEIATVTSVITGKVVETIVDNEEVVSAVETIAQESDKVTVDVVTKDKTTKAVVDTSKVQAPKSTDAENIVVGVIGSTVAEIVTKDKDTEDTIKEIVKETGTVNVDVTAGDKKTGKPVKDSQIEVIVKSDEVVLDEKDVSKPVTEVTEVTKEVTVVETTEVTGVIADTVTEILVADKETVSAIEDVVKEAKYVTVEVVAGDKVTKTIVDTTTVTEDVILGSKDKPFTSSVVVGAVTEAITDDKDVTAVLESIVEANEGVAINIIVGEQDVDTTAKDQIFVIVKKTDVLVEEDKPTVKTIEEIATVTSVITGKVVETIVDNEEVVSAVETIAQESEKVTVDVVTKDKTTKAVVDTSKVQAPKSTDAENIVVGVIGSTVAEIVTKDKDTEDTIKEIVKETGTVNVDVTAGDKKTGKPVKDSQIEVIVKSDEVVLDEKDVSKPVTEVTEVTKEVTVVETTEVTGVIADTVTEILVADKETVSAIEDVVKEAKYVTVEVVAGDKVTKTIVDTTTVTEDVILGSKDKPFTSSVVVGAVTEAITDDKDVTAVLESIVEANEGVAINIIVGEQDVDTTAKDQIFVIVKKTDVLVEEDKPTVKTIEEIATVTSVITGKVVETIVDNEEVVSAVETIAQESEKVTVDVVTKDKTTKAVVDTSKVQAPKSTDAENIVVGVIGSTVAEIVTKDKDTEDTIKEIVKETGTVNVDVTAGDKKTGKPVKDSQIEVIVKSDEVVLDEKDVSKPVTEVTEVTKEVTVVETTEVTGVIADTVTEILVADKETVSAIEDVVKEAKYVTVEVVAGDKVTKTIVDTTTVTEDVILGSKDKPFTSSVVVGAVTEAITDDKDVTAVLESIVEANEGVAINIIVGEQDVDTTAKDQIFVIVKKTDVLVEEDKPTVKTIEEIATVTSVITGKVVETIVDNEEVVSAVETIAQESDKVTVDVVTKDKTTKAVVDTSKVQAPKSTDAENIVVGVIGSTVAEIVTKDKDTEDTIKEIVKETGTVNVDVTAGDKKTGKPVKDSQIEVIVKSDEVVLDEKDVSKPVTEVTEVTKEVTVVETTEVTGVIADTVTEILVADKETVSAIEDVVKEAKYVTVEVVAGDKVTKTIVDTTTVTEDVILGSKDKPFTSSVVVGAVTEAITDDKDVTAVLESIVEANEGVAINIIVGEQDVDTTAKDQIFVIVKKTDVLVEEDKPTVKTIEEIATVTSVITGKVVETIVDNEEVVSAVETIAQESDKVTVDVVTKDKTTKAVVDTSKVQAPKSTDAENIVVGVIGSTVAEIVTKDKDTEDTIKEIVKETGTVNVDVTAGDKKTGKPVKDSQIEVIVKSDEVVLDEKDVSKPVTEVTEVTKEVTVVETTEVTGVIADTVTEILVADKETVSAIEDVVKEAKYVTVEVVAGDKVTKTIVDTTTVTEDVILGSKDKPFTSSVVVGAVTEAITDDKDVTAVLESIVEANEGVAINIIVGEQDVDTTAKDQIFVIVKKTDVLVEEDKPTVKTIEEIVTVTEIAFNDVVKKSDIVDTTVIGGEKKIENVFEVIAAERQPVTSEKQAIADQKDIISVIDLVSKTQEKPTTIVTEAITETIDGHEDVSSTVENIIQESDHVVVEVIIDGKKTETIVNTSDVETETIPKSGTISSAIISSVIAEAIQERDVPVYETDKLVLQVAAGDKKVDSIIPSKIQDTTDSEIKIEVVVKGYDVTSNEKFMTDDKKYNAPKEISVDIVADAVAEAIVIDQEKVSAIKEISKTSDLITVDVISESKKTGAVLDKSTIEEVISEIDSTEKKKPAHSTVDTFKNTSEVICTVDEKKFVEEGTKDKVDVATVKKTTEEEIVDSTEGSTVTEEEVVSIAVGSDKPKKTIPASDDSKSVTADIDVSKKVVNAQILEDEKVIVVEKSEIEEVTKGDRVEEIVGAGEKIVEDTAGKTTVTISREIAPVEHVEVIKGVENAAEVTYSWLSGFVEKINSMLEVGDCKEDVDAAIVAEESKLQVILEKSKTGSTAGVQELDVYYDKLHDTFKSQISDIKTSVNEAYVENKTPQKIVFHDVKEELKKNIDVQVEKAKQVIHEKVVPRTITQKLEADSGSDVVVTEAAKISEIVRYQNVEQAQKGTKAAVAAVVQDTQEKLESWYDVLFGKIRGVIASTETEAGDKKREIQRLITDANEEASAIITEGKKAFEFDYTVSDDCESNVTVTVQDAQKQAIDSFDNIQKIVSTQISAVEEIVVSDDDLEIIEERVSIIETQSKRKAATALENTTEAAISVGFEGKSVTWVETTEFPASFKDVKVFAFDLPDTVVNYRLTISQAWNNVVSKKKPSKFAHIDVEKLVVRWYNVFLEQRCKINYSTCDREVLLISLKLVLTEHSLENAFTDEELDTLCTTWFKLQPFGDSSSLQKINQLDNMYSVSISCGFKLCTLMKVARNAGLNWHAQFTGDVFAACIVRDDITDIKSTSNTVLSNAAMLCCLQSPGELAVVSSNPEILQVAKQNGSKTVLIDRYENNPATQDYDIHFDGLDIFAESYETFHETKTITKTEVPVTRSWFQRVVSTVSDAAESVTHAVIG